MLLGATMFDRNAYDFAGMTPAERIEAALRQGSMIHGQYRSEYRGGVAGKGDPVGARCRNAVWAACERGMRRLLATLAAALFLVPGLHDPARADAGAPVARQEMLPDTDQVAAVVAFIRTHWGNDWKDPVAPGDVASQRPPASFATSSD